MPGEAAERCEAVGAQHSPDTKPPGEALCSGEAAERCEAVGAAQRRRRARAPMASNPPSISAQVCGSGTAATASML